MQREDFMQILRRFHAEEVAEFQWNLSGISAESQRNRSRIVPELFRNRSGIVPES